MKQSAVNNYYHHQAYLCKFKICLVLDIYSTTDAIGDGGNNSGPSGDTRRLSGDMIFEISTEVSSIQALFDERSKNGGGGDSGDTIAILESSAFF